MSSPASDPKWLSDYYSRLLSEQEFSHTRRDTVTNWGLTLFLAVVAVFATSLTPQASLSTDGRIGIVAIGLGLSVRFFVQGMIAYAFLIRWRHIRQKIELHWTSGTPSLDEIVRRISIFDHQNRVPLHKWDMFSSQIRAGFLLILVVLSGLLLFEIWQEASLTLATEIILILLAFYLLWELIAFLKYPQLKYQDPEKLPEDMPKELLQPTVQHHRLTNQSRWLILTLIIETVVLFVVAIFRL